MLNQQCQMVMNADYRERVINKMINFEIWEEY